ncbi:unnamed protein product, partial [Mortierella alpina]
PQIQHLKVRQQRGSLPTGPGPTPPTPLASSTTSPQPGSPLPSSDATLPINMPGSSGGTVIGPGGVIPVQHSPSNSSQPFVGSGTVIGPSSVIDPRRPVSRLSMIQPKQNAANPPLFPVGCNIPLEWTFDNATLVFPPGNLSVEVSLTSNPKMIWPIANISGTATSVIWNTATVAGPPLIMSFYTLSIYDTKIGKQGVATSGHLMPYSDLQFGIYIPEPYVPRGEATATSLSPTCPALLLLESPSRRHSSPSAFCKLSSIDSHFLAHPSRTCTNHMAAYSKATNPLTRVRFSFPGTRHHDPTPPLKPFAPLVLFLIFFTLWPSCWLPLVDSTSVPKLQSETYAPLALQVKNLNPLVPGAAPRNLESARLSSPLHSKLSVRSASNDNTRDLVQRDQQTATVKPRATSARIDWLQASAPTKSKDRPPASTMTPIPESSSEAPAPEPRGDFALFGKPSVVGHFNLTAGILVNTTFTVLLLASAGLGTWQRAQSRRRFQKEVDQAGFMEAGYSSNSGVQKQGRQSLTAYSRRAATDSTGNADDSRRYAISGRGSSSEKKDPSRTAPTKRSSTGRQALTSHIGPRAAITTFGRNQSKPNGATGTNNTHKQRSPRQYRRAEAQAGPSVRFGNDRKDFRNARTGTSQMQQGLKKLPVGGMRRSSGGSPPDHPRLRNEDDYRKDTADTRFHIDFNRPGYSLPRLPKPVLRQQILQQYQPLPRPLQSTVTRTNPLRMPDSATSSLSSTPTISKESSRNAERKGSRSMAVDPSRSIARSHSDATPRSATQFTKPAARIGGSAGIGACFVGVGGPQTSLLKNSYPTPIRRSSSKRLPPQMHG